MRITTCLMSLSRPEPRGGPDASALRTFRGRHSAAKAAVAAAPALVRRRRLVSSGIGLLRPGVPVTATSTIQSDQGRGKPTISLINRNSLMNIYIHDESSNITAQNDWLTGHSAARGRHRS